MDCASIFFLAAMFVCAYVCGLFPSGPLLALGSKKLGGKKLTESGSGGTGATNVLRLVGLRAALLVLILDFSKAVVALLLVRKLAETALVAGLLSPKTLIFNHGHAIGVGFANGEHFISLCLAVGVVGCLSGHCFPLWSKGLRGGKGVASAAGLLLVLQPSLLLSALLLWSVVFLFFGYSSLASMSAGLLVFVAAVFLASEPLSYGLGHVFLGYGLDYGGYGLALGVAMVIFRHKENITRLWRGEEKRLYDRQGGKNRGSDKNSKKDSK